MELGIAGKRALVLGASRGLGRAIAEGLATEGVEVFAAARSVDRITDWSADLPNVTPMPVDLADHASVMRLAETLLSAGGVDILVTNSGGPAPGPAATSARGDWIAQFEAMAANIFDLSARLLPGMRARGWGRIICITSSGVEQPIPNLALSNGIRSAVVGWAKTLAAEVAADGVTVNVVLPGRIHTDRVDELDAAAAKRTGKPVEDIKSASAASIPMGRYGKPSEFADMVVFLASERASYVTGSRVRIDGGSIRS
ncbi:SDR family oxidoreductase [Rhodophyticola sp.]|jgi:3-oxoacyl-[acyl-carrier protein] reductase|uniref:SDR family oxidoreductase n=1 Tax=Rhodophyticola sp. TaxID=2680032 RepID=UPI003D2D790B